MLKRRSPLILSLCLAGLVACNTVKMEVPAAAVGWYYIIPISDKNHGLVLKNQGYYLPDKNGIIYILDEDMDLRNRQKVKVFRGLADISDSIRYMAAGYQKGSDGLELRYIQFYIPNSPDLEITDLQFWRDSRYRFQQESRLDSLISAGQVILN